MVEGGWTQKRMVERVAGQEDAIRESLCDHSATVGERSGLSASSDVAEGA
jgi:hypothetical protein